MSTVTWLHLSDIHFQATTEWRANPARESLLAFLQQRFDKDPSLKPDFITCTGDIAFGSILDTALKDQYALAATFFDDVLKLCGDGEQALAKERLFLVPGNHDINRKTVDKRAQRALVAMAADSADCVDEINQDFADNNNETQGAMKRLAEYSQFVKDYLGHQHDETGRCFYTQNLTINDITVGIAGFNSAWSCGGNEDDRHLWLAGEWQFNQAQERLAGQQLRIGLMHHPVDWLAQAERSVATRRLEHDFHFFLHGHTHDAWINDGNNLKTIGAGATGAKDAVEFGFNISQLDLASGQAKVHLYTYSPKHNAWMNSIDPNHAPDGIWPLSLQQELIQAQPEVEESLEPEHQEPPQLQITKQTLFGREKLLKQAEQYLKLNNCLLVYGMRGNGKSVFIDEMSRRSPLQETTLVRIQVNSFTNAGIIYQQLAGLIGDKRENVTVPSGEIEDMLQTLEARLNPDKAYCIWLENAHQLFANNSFIDLALRKLLIALRQLLPDWYWIFELRERPEPGVVVNSQSLEMPGLDKPTLGEFLSSSTPADIEPWLYKGDKLKSIYQWLGGGHGQQAHPQATHLLIEVAKGLNETPYEVLRRRLEFFEQELEDFLLGDLYHEVLNRDEQQLFCSLALYRVPIPAGHIKPLEAKMQLNNAWHGLDLRCLLSTNPNASEFYLHGFIAGWLRQLQGYALEEEEYNQLPLGLEVSEEVVDRQRNITECWQDSVTGRKRVTMTNINRTNEALFHQMAAGGFEGLKNIAVDMLGADRESVYNWVFALSQHLYQIDAPSSQQRGLLEFLILLKPEDHKLYRFLGSLWKSEKGWKDKRVLDNFKKAVEIQPDRPEYWSSYGKACLKQNLAVQFIAELQVYEQSTASPTGINGFVLAVKADCLKAIGDSEGAFELRQQQILLGSDNPAIYVDQAQAYMAQDKPALALDILALAEKNGVGNDHTLNVQANILAKTGNDDGAIKLRQRLIDSGTQNPTFYNDQAQAYLAQDKPEKALSVLALAAESGAGDEFSLSIKANALDQSGEVEQAMALRQQQIDNCSKNGVFYNAQAEAYLKQNQPKLALDVLLLAEKNGADDVTRNIKAKVLRQLP